MIKAIFLLVAILPAIALAQLPPDSGVGFLDMIMHYLGGVGAGVVASLIVIIETLLRLVPTQVPMSILSVVKKVLDVVIWIIQFVSNFLGKLVVSGNRVK